MFIFSGKREKAPASTSFLDARLSCGGAQSLPFVCLRGRDGAEEKTQLFFRLPSAQNIHTRPVSDASLQMWVKNITQEISTAFSILEWIRFHFLTTVGLVVGRKSSQQ